MNLRAVDLASTGDPGFVTEDGRTTFALIQAPILVAVGPYVEASLDPALAKAAAARGFTSGLASYGLLAAGGGDTVGTGVLVEVLLGAARSAGGTGGYPAGSPGSCSSSLPGGLRGGVGGGDGCRPVMRLQGLLEGSYCVGLVHLSRIRHPSRPSPWRRRSQIRR